MSELNTDAVELSRADLRALLECAAIDADERTFCAICGASEYVYAREGQLKALRAIPHRAGCIVPRLQAELARLEAEGDE